MRAVPLLERQAQAAKVAAALGAAAAARASERGSLEAAVQVGSVTGLELVNASLVRRHEEEAEAALAALESGALDAAAFSAELAALGRQLEEDQEGLLAGAASCPDLPFYSPGGRIWFEVAGERGRRLCGGAVACGRAAAHGEACHSFPVISPTRRPCGTTRHARHLRARRQPDPGGAAGAAGGHGSAGAGPPGARCSRL